MSTNSMLLMVALLVLAGGVGWFVGRRPRRAGSPGTKATPPAKTPEPEPKHASPVPPDDAPASAPPPPPREPTPAPVDYGPVAAQLREQLEAYLAEASTRRIADARESLRVEATAYTKGKSIFNPKNYDQGFVAGLLPRIDALTTAFAHEARRECRDRMAASALPEAMWIPAEGAAPPPCDPAVAGAIAAAMAPLLPQWSLVAHALEEKAKAKVLEKLDEQLAPLIQQGVEAAILPVREDLAALGQR